ncbi:MAG: YihA family ribosome biogenesis GTP-binding protein [Elusimicrobia bacterium]|nr:YihA family ribosome biogenesis GTP-binding protein [Elusimicrobiota bacterium]
MRTLLDDVKFLLSESAPERLPPCVAEVTFVGRSNVGKSTLLNALCRKDLARVSSTPGRTRLINVFLVGKDRWLVDLPGYGFAAGPKAERAGWGPMIEAYLSKRPSLRMVFLLVDAKVGPTKLDLEMADWLQSHRLPWRPVATKSDQVKAGRTVQQKREWAAALGVSEAALGWVSADTGSGIRALGDEVSALLRDEIGTT